MIKLINILNEVTINKPGKPITMIKKGMKENTYYFYKDFCFSLKDDKFVAKFGSNNTAKDVMMKYFFEEKHYFKIEGGYITTLKKYVQII